MDLNQFSTVDIVLDKANDNIIQKQTISAGDRDGRSLTLQVTDAGSIGEVPGLTANLLWTNHSSGVSDLSAFSVVDRLTSVFKIEYPQNMLTAGKVTAQIQLLHNGKVTHSKKFEIIVLDVAGKLKGVLQSAEYTALVEALAKTNEFETDIAEVSAQLAQTVRIDESNLSLNNFNEHDRAVIQGLADGEINAVLGDGNVVNENLAKGVITPGKLSEMYLEGNPLNLFDYTTISKVDGYYSADGILVNEPPGYRSSDFIKVEAGARYYIGRNTPAGQIALNFYDENKQRIGGAYSSTVVCDTTTSFVVPIGAHYVKIPVLMTSLKETWVAKSESDIFLQQPVLKHILSLDDDNSILKGTLNGKLGSYPVQELKNNPNFVIGTNLSFNAFIKRNVDNGNISNAVVAEYDLSKYIGQTVTLKGEYDLFTNDPNVTKGQLKISESTLTQVGSASRVFKIGSEINYTTGTNMTVSLTVDDYVVSSTYPKIGLWMYGTTVDVDSKSFNVAPRIFVNGEQVHDFTGIDAGINAKPGTTTIIDNNDITLPKNENKLVSVKAFLDNIGNNGNQINHWQGKTWYAYGTSITSTAQGKYVPYLATLSGLNYVNKGIPGGGILNGQVKSAVMNTTDGKLEADLITLEVGANEGSEPIGDKFDIDDSTFCGGLNQAIRYLQENTNAQIVVMPSVATTAEPSTYQEYYERHTKIKEVCEINNVYYIDGDSGLGWARIKNDTTYTLDNIHQTDLGGYNLAHHIWSKLKNIPLWYTTLP